MQRAATAITKISVPPKIKIGIKSADLNSIRNEIGSISQNDNSYKLYLPLTSSSSISYPSITGSLASLEFWSRYQNSKLN
jgi:hypothetical protein